MAKIITENFKVETTNELFKSFKSQNTTLGNNFMQELALIDAASSLSESDNTIIRGLVDDQLEALNILFPNIWLAAAEYKKFI